MTIMGSNLKNSSQPRVGIKRAVTAVITVIICTGFNLPATSQASVSMTVYAVHKNGSGKQSYTNQYHQTVELPGAGVSSNTVSVYSSPDGSQWYIDKTGQLQPLPRNEQHFASGTTPHVTASENEIPVGHPVYWGAGGAPYYYGTGGSKVFISQNNASYNNFTEWRNESNRWHNSFWGSQDNSGNSWPGKDHGFPPPTRRAVSDPGLDKTTGQKAADHRPEAANSMHANDQTRRADHKQTPKSPDSRKSAHKEAPRRGSDRGGHRQ